MRIPGQRSVKPPSRWDSFLISNLKPYVRQSGDEWRSPWHLPSRKLLDYLLVYVEEGRGVFTVGDKRDVEVGDGDFVWIPPDTPHEMCGTSTKMHCMYIHFDLAYDPERSHWDAYIPGGTNDLKLFKKMMHPRFPDSDVNTWFGKLTVGNSPVAGRLMMEICEIHGKYGNAAALRLSIMMTQLIDLFRRSVMSEKKDLAYSYKMILALEQILKDDSVPYEDSSAAKSAGMSRSHFRKIFREFHGESPRDVHTRFRMKKACELLVYNDLNVSECAVALGFSNVHNFSRAFKTHFGVSPREYRMKPFDVYGKL